MDDAKIIELFWTRDETAIQETDCAYGKKLFGLAYKILHDGQDTEEIVSDTYMRAWETIPPQQPVHFFAYLASICRNFALNRLDWKEAAKRKGEIVALTAEMELCIPDSRQEMHLEERELGRIMNAFLAELPKESRMIFLRRYWFLDTIGEIAVRYHISESKVKMRLHRTREKLRCYLEKEGITV